MKLIRYCLTGIILFTLFSCNSNDEENKLADVLSSAKEYNNDLTQVLEHYRQDSLKLVAAKFLITNLPGNVSYDSSHLVNYRPILYKLDSLRKSGKIDEKEALNRIDLEWESFTQEHSIQLDVYAKLNQDLYSISPDYLIENIDQAFETWQQSRFKDSTNFHDFMHYLLPYRKQNGYVIEPWREYFISNYGQYMNRYPSIRQTTDTLLELTKNYHVEWLKISDYPFICLQDYSLAKISRCPARCWFNAMLLCSLGIPCTIDFVPAWANHNSSHSWNAIVANGKTYPFEATGGRGMWHNKLVYNNVWEDKYWIKSRLPKVFRFSYVSIKEGPSADLECNIQNTPARFLNPQYKDVSSEYFETSDIQIPIKGKGLFSKKPKYAYLFVFNEDRWQPVYWGKVKSGAAYFKKMGRDIVYLPAIYNNGRIEPINDAFILQQDGNIRYLTPNLKTEISASLDRKYLARPDVGLWREWNTRGCFEVSDNQSFKNPQKIFTVANCKSIPTIWELDQPVETRYIRYLFPEKLDVLAELYFFKRNKTSNTLEKINGNKIIPRGVDSAEAKFLFDEDLLTFADLTRYRQQNHQQAPWIGVDLSQNTEIAAVGICPRNDKNNIIKNMEYELFYWNNQWISLGKKIAKDYYITYDHIPGNALLYIKCTSEGKENRIFTWEENTQKWW